MNMSEERAANQASQDTEAAPVTVEQALAAIPPAKLRLLRSLRLAGQHLLVWIVAMGVFAATDSWSLLSGLGLADALAVVTGALAGVITTTLIHEWFHFIGARLSGGAYGIPEKFGLFVYDWDFRRNDTRQFFTMSVAGSVGGALSLLLVWYALPAATPGRAAVFAGTLAGFVFGSVIEWPVLRAVRFGGEPLAELSKIDERVLLRALLSATAAGLLVFYLLAP